LITDLNTKKITYAFGMPMSVRSYQSSSGYRYGMNGQEKDNEIVEGIYTAEFWEYDSRTGKRWNIDPVVKPWESSYACFSNNPIFYSDPTGETATPPDKILHDDNGGEDRYVKDATGTDYITEEYGHYTNEEKTGFVSRATITSEDKQVSNDQQARRNEQLAPSQRISKILDNAPKDLIAASPKAAKGVAGVVILASALTGQPEGIAAGVSLYNYADNVENAMTAYDAGKDILTGDSNQKKQGVIKLIGVAADVGTGKLVEGITTGDKLLEGVGTISTDVINDKIIDNSVNMVGPK